MHVCVDNDTDIFSLTYDVFLTEKHTLNGKTRLNNKTSRQWYIKHFLLNVSLHFNMKL